MSYIPGSSTVVKNKKLNFKNVLVTQLIAVVFFVIIPIILTLMAPFTDLTLRNAEQGVDISIKRYVLFFIPWKTENLDSVKSLVAEITAEKRYADTAENRRRGRVGTSLATAQLVIQNSSEETIVQVDPKLAKEVEKNFNDFVISKSTTPKTLQLYASWGLSYIMGGVATFFCGFYLFGCIAAILRYPFKKS